MNRGLLTFLLALVGLASIGHEAIAKPTLDFAREVAPIFERHCIRCHQPANTKSQLSLATFAELAANEYVIPGDPVASHLIQVVTSIDGQPPVMPKEGAPLSVDEVDTLRTWVTEGAHWPADVVIRERSKADRTWWSLQPLAVTEPQAEDVPAEWSTNPVDRYIFAQLQASKLRPNPRADRRTLIRRVTYDLTGLPPTPEEIDAFLRDDSPNAYETSRGSIAGFAAIW